MVHTAILLLIVFAISDFTFPKRNLSTIRHNGNHLILEFTVLYFLYAAICISMGVDVLLLSVLHLSIDRFTRLVEDRGISRIIALGLHILRIYAFSLILPNLFETSIFSYFAPWVLNASVILVGLTIACNSGSEPIETLLRCVTDTEVSSSTPLLDESNKNASEVIGYIERSAIYLLILIDAPEGIGFMLAAKVVMRFQTGPKDPKQNELVYIGTLASFGWAILVSLAILFLLALLPDLGIALPRP